MFAIYAMFSHMDIHQANAPRNIRRLYSREFRQARAGSCDKPGYFGLGRRPYGIDRLEMPIIASLKRSRCLLVSRLLKRHEI